MLATTIITTPPLMIEQPLLNHLRDLRYCLIISLTAWVVSGIICYMHAQALLDWLIAPLAAAWNNSSHCRLIYTGLAEGFLVHWRLGIYGGLILAFPIWAWQLWKFVAPGLYRHERKFMSWCLVLGPALFLVGALMVYFVVLPMAWKFFLSFETTTATATIPLAFEPRVENYVTLVLKLMLIFGLCFQLPLLMVVAAKLGWICLDSLRSYRRHAIVAIFIVAAIITPPDVISQLMLAVPLVFLYEIAVLAVKFMVKS